MSHKPVNCIDSLQISIFTNTFQLDSQLLCKLAYSLILLLNGTRVKICYITFIIELLICINVYLFYSFEMFCNYHVIMFLLFLFNLRLIYMSLNINMYILIVYIFTSNYFINITYNMYLHVIIILHIFILSYFHTPT